MRSLLCAGALFAFVLGCSSSSGERFIGTWESIHSADHITITKEGTKYVVRDHGDAFPSDLSGSALKSGTLLGDVTFTESTGHIFWRGMEMQKRTPPTP